MRHLAPLLFTAVVLFRSENGWATHPCREDAGPCDCCHGSECPPECFRDAAGGSAGRAQGGSAGSGGTGGSAGSTGSAGTSSGGSAGTGGSSGTGPGGSTATGGAGDDDGGCSCRLGPASSNAAWLLGLLLGLAAFRRAFVRKNRI